MREAAARLPKIAVFGVPSAAGASGPGGERGAFALREAGLLEALRGIGARVVNLFGWGVGDSNNPFRKTAESASALAAYRKFLEGGRLAEFVLPTPLGR